ncbi:hypothetical protein QUA52_30350, partial [Microcoleus sp. N9_A3]|uniref:hypothetical protein n=1 Tax=Microcoleus sp. N9_A3 TaxID=3055382 RepID=UPI002FD1E795
MNIFVGLLSLAALLFILISPQAPAELRPGFARALAAGGIAMFLVVASIAALMGRQHARLGMLGAALVFFGMLAIQNILLIAELSGTGDRSTAPRVAPMKSRDSSQRRVSCASRS